MKPEEVTPDVLIRVTGHAVQLFLSRAEHFEAWAAPDIALSLSGEPVADLNYITVMGDSPGVVAKLETYVARCDELELPFLAMLGPEVSDAVPAACERLELLHAGAFPLMVCPAAGVEAFPRPGVEVRPVRTPADANGSAAALAEAFSMPLDSTLRTLPLAVCDAPGIDVHVACREDRVLSTVTVTVHDRLAGIWAMGTLPETQGQGVGKALLSQVMAEYRDRGVESFFLGATAAGKPLYERLGYVTVSEAQVWVRGETGQA